MIRILFEGMRVIQEFQDDNLKVKFCRVKFCLIIANRETNDPPQMLQECLKQNLPEDLM